MTLRHSEFNILLRFHEGPRRILLLLLSPFGSLSINRGHDCRTVWTRRGGIGFCARTCGTRIATTFTRSTRPSVTSTRTGRGASRARWPSATDFCRCSATARSQLPFWGWRCCTRPRVDAATSSTSSWARGRARGARRCPTSSAYLCSGERSRPFWSARPTTPRPTRICPNCWSTTWPTSWDAGESTELLLCYEQDRSQPWFDWRWKIVV